MSKEVFKRAMHSRDELHHAYFITGQRRSLRDQLIEHLENVLSIKAAGHPDVHIHEYDSLGIDDGRALQGHAIQRPLQDKKLFIITLRSLTREAQNALLKLFEEPKRDTHFFLISDTAEYLLPTIRSRMYMIDAGLVSMDNSYQDQAATFLKQPLPKRLVMLKEYLDAKDKDGLYNLLGALEYALHGRTDRESVRGLAEIIRAKQYLFDRSASIKLLLEHVAMSAPRLQ